MIYRENFEDENEMDVQDTVQFKEKEGVSLTGREIKALATTALVVWGMILVGPKLAKEIVPNGVKFNFELNSTPSVTTESDDGITIPVGVVTSEAVTTTEPIVTTTEVTTTTTPVTTTTVNPYTPVATITVYDVITRRNVEYKVVELSTSLTSNVRKFSLQNNEVNEITEYELFYTFTTIDGETMTLSAKDCSLKIERSDV